MRQIQEKEYPKFLYIGDTVYKIKFVKTLPGNIVGLCDSLKETIYIKKGLGPSSTLKTFIHESLHALEFYYNIPIKHKVVAKLENAIFDLLMQNF